MHFFLYEIVYRIVALYLCVTSSRTVWFGIVERKIRIFSHDFIDWVLDLFLDESIKVVHRDTAPIRYWTQIGIQIFVAVGASLVRSLAGGSQTPEHPLMAQSQQSATSARYVRSRGAKRSS